MRDRGSVANFLVCSSSASPRRRNAPGADFSTFATPWVNEHIRSKGPLGKHYPFPCCIHEGDTPSFLGLINNGLASFMSPTYGGWGGRYVFRTSFGESRPFWTQGGDSFPGRDSSRDTVVGIDGCWLFTHSSIAGLLHTVRSACGLTAAYLPSA